MINGLQTTKLNPGIVSVESSLVLRSTEVHPAFALFVLFSYLHPVQLDSRDVSLNIKSPRVSECIPYNEKLLLGLECHSAG